MIQPPSGHYAPPASATCTWHPDRPTALSCTRCGRPACPDCLTPASVGFHCRQCAADGRSQRPVARTVAGGVHGQQPVVSFVLMGLNIAIFVIAMVQAGGEGGLGRSVLFAEGALTPMIVASGAWWQLFTSGFLHASVLHIAMNMLALYMIGVGLERFLGPVRFAVVYLLSLLGGSAAVYLLADVDTRTVGASGAVFGLLGALAVTLRRLRLDMRQLGVILVLNAIITFTQPAISWQAHLGGFVVGAIIGAAMVYPPRASRAAWQWGTGAGLLVALVAVILLRDATIGEWVCTEAYCRQIRP